MSVEKLLGSVIKLACKGICHRISGCVNYKNRKCYGVGTTGIKCGACEIHLPIDHPEISIGRNGGKYCPCCGHRMSTRINNKKKYIEQLVAKGVVVRY